jgi:hypothetical protein
MAFPPGDPILGRLLSEIRPALDRYWHHAPEEFVLESTGPFMLTRVIRQASRRDLRGIRLYDHRYFHPLTRDEIHRIRRMPSHADLLRRLNGAYAVHLHEGTWRKPPEERIEPGRKAVETPRVQGLHQPTER